MSTIDSQNPETDAWNMKNISHLSLAEIEGLLIAAEKRKALLSRRRPLSDVQKRLVAMARSYGYEISELFEGTHGLRVTGPRLRAPKRSKIPPKYRDPANPRNTWSGRGRMPRWLADNVRRGNQAADYLIPGIAKPTGKNAKSIGRRTVFKPVMQPG